MTATARDLDPFPIGARVTHSLYGEATVVRHEPDKGVFHVQCDTGKELRLVARLAKVTLKSGQTFSSFTFDAEKMEQEVREEVRKQTVRNLVRDALAAAEEGPSQPADGGFLRELLARPEEPAWRVEGLVPADAGTLVVAARKTGKTTLNLNLTRSLLTGEDFLGKFGVEKVEGIVAVLNFEVSGRTFARWADEHGIDHDRLYVENLRGRRNPFRHPEDRAKLAEKLKSYGTEALIVDPFGRAYTGKSQNDPGEVTSWLVELDEFARSEVGARDVILNAHAGWNGERTRGSSALEDWADVFLTMTRDPDDDTQRFLKAEGRDVLLDEDRLDFRAETRTLYLAGIGSRAKVKTTRKLTDLAVFVIRAARENPGAGVAELIAAIREMGDAPAFRDGDVSKAAKYAQEQGRLRIEGGGPGRKTRHFEADPQPLPTPANAPTGRTQPTPSTPSIREGVVGGGGQGVVIELPHVEAVNIGGDAS